MASATWTTPVTPTAGQIAGDGTGGTWSYSAQVPNNLRFLHQWNGAAAYRNTNQSIVKDTNVKIVLDTEPTGGDLHGWFDATTNNRFQPGIAATMLIEASATFGAASNASRARLMIYKNGAEVKRAVKPLSTTIETELLVFAAVTFNGTTDYVEIYVWHEASDPLTLLGGPTWNGFLASRIGA